jgi:hypothetical protein
MTAFARALADHLGAPEHRARIVVPEWAGVLEPDSQGEPAVYARPLSAALMADLGDARLADEQDLAAEVIVRLAETETGDRLFDRGDKATLLGAVSADVLIRIADRIAASASTPAAAGMDPD